MKFLRRTWNRYVKLGKGRKKKQVWRRPTGRDNKMREKRKGYPAVVSLGYKKPESLRGMMREKKPILVMNVKDLEKVRKNEIAVVGNVGKRKKIELAKNAKEKGIEIYNLNAKKFLRDLEKKKKQKEIKKQEKGKKKESSKKKIKEEKVKTKEKKIKEEKNNEK